MKATWIKTMCGTRISTLSEGAPSTGTSVGGLRSFENMERVWSFITVVTRMNKRTENSKGYSERMRMVTINLGVSSNQIWACIHLEVPSQLVVFPAIYLA